jgi:hypothetical protein
VIQENCSEGGLRYIADVSLIKTKPRKCIVRWRKNGVLTVAGQSFQHNGIGGEDRGNQRIKFPLERAVRIQGNSNVDDCRTRGGRPTLDLTMSRP